jgi:hypothetical protein
MGDVGDYWRDVREHFKSQGRSRPRGRRRAQFVKFTKTHERDGFHCCSEWHWQATVAGDLLDYWPSKNKWRWRGVTATGSYADLKSVIEQH